MRMRQDFRFHFQNATLIDHTDVQGKGGKLVENKGVCFIQLMESQVVHTLKEY